VFNSAIPTPTTVTRHTVRAMESSLTGRTDARRKRPVYSAAPLNGEAPPRPTHLRPFPMSPVSTDLWGPILGISRRFLPTAAVRCKFSTGPLAGGRPRRCAARNPLTIGDRLEDPCKHGITAQFAVPGVHISAPGRRRSFDSGDAAEARRRHRWDPFNGITKGALVDGDIGGNRLFGSDDS
jgi:hypothetical protein